MVGTPDRVGNGTWTGAASHLRQSSSGRCGLCVPGTNARLVYSGIWAKPVVFPEATREWMSTGG